MRMGDKAASRRHIKCLSGTVSLAAKLYCRRNRSTDCPAQPSTARCISELARSARCIASASSQSITIFDRAHVHSPTCRNRSFAQPRARRRRRHCKFCGKENGFWQLDRSARCEYCPSLPCGHHARVLDDKSATASNRIVSCQHRPRTNQSIGQDGFATHVLRPA